MSDDVNAAFVVARDALDALDVGVVVIDLAGRVEFANRRFLDACGYAQGEVAGQNGTVLISGLTPPAVLETLWSTARAGGAWRGDVVLRRKHGETFTRNVDVTPVRDAAGTVVRHVVFVAMAEAPRPGATDPVVRDRPSSPGTRAAQDPLKDADAVQELREAIAGDQLVVHYQPQVNLGSGEVVGVEALVRWQHPTNGMVPPGRFIPLAESSGLIVELDEWVLHAATRQARVWQDAGLRPITVAVNWSARHFRGGLLAESIGAALEDARLEARYLEIEVTESAMMRDVALAERTIVALREIGVHISLDDFGTGYSSLSYLSRLPIDMLKVDQSFVRDVTSNPVDAAIVDATIAMAHRLGKSVIAEGVETEAQMTFLRRHDCDEIQGYLFSRPVPPQEIEDMLRTGRRLALDGARGERDLRTLLVVDDEPNILHALTRVFRREGYRLISASSGAEALEKMALETVHVVITDQRMPGMTGVEFLRRAKDMHPHSVRIVLSGYTDLETVRDAVNRGAVWKYFEKPWDDDALRDEVRQAFQRAARTSVLP